MAINYFGANIFQVYISTFIYFSTSSVFSCRKIKMIFFVAASKIHLRKLCLDNNFNEAKIPFVLHPPYSSTMESSRLNPFELKAILKWIDSFALSRSSKKLSRDFSDAVLLAEILKFEFPKLVDMHNYTACNSVQGKVQNWSALNRKVLKKLNVHLKEEEIERLAKAEMNFIEEVIFEVMNKVKVAKSCEEESSSKSAIGNKKSNDIMTVTIRRQVGDHCEHVPQQMILYSSYDELQQKCDAQQILIDEQRERIDDLQNAIESKNLIIADLNERLEKRHKKSNQPLSISSIKDSIANLF